MSKTIYVLIIISLSALLLIQYLDIQSLEQNKDFLKSEVSSYVSLLDVQREQSHYLNVSIQEYKQRLLVTSKKGDFDSLKAVKSAMEKESYCGLYNPQEKMIVVLTDGCGDVEFTLTHEYAHYLMYQEMPSEDVEWWKKTYFEANNSQDENYLFRNYSYTNYKEFYADYYAYNNRISPVPATIGRYWEQVR